MHKKLLSVGIIFSLGLLIGMLNLSSSEVYFGSDNIGNYILYERIMDQEEVNAYVNTGLILQYDVDIEGGTTQFWYDPENTQGLTSHEIEEYLSGQEQLRELRQLNVQQDLLNQIPYDCRRSDLDESRIFGIFTLNDGSDFAEFNNSYCWELLHE